MTGNTNGPADPTAFNGEVWRPIPGCEGLYQVSNLGRARSEPARGQGIGTRKGRILTGQPDSKGYLQIHMHLSGGKEVTMRVHRAVALAFLGPRPPGAQINHKSGNKLDNSVANLEYVTGLENIRHARSAGLFDANQPKGETHGRSKLTAEKVRQIRAMHVTMSLTELAEHFGVGKPTIHHVIKGRTWRHVA